MSSINVNQTIEQTWLVAAKPARRFRETMKYCPQCRSKSVVFDNVKRFGCRSCGWDYFQNPAATVAGLLEYQGKILAVRRNREPARGMLDLPGGFVDPNESLEEALQRELLEELKVEALELSYLCSAPNFYEFAGVTYATCDSFFTGRLPHTDFIVDRSEIAEILLFAPHELKPEALAFPSLRTGMKRYLSRMKNER